MWRDLKRIYTRHRDFSLLLVLVGAFFVMALLFLRPGGYILEWWGYYMPHTGYVRLSDQGLYPYVHYWMEYPPLLSWLPIAAYRLSRLLPVWNHPWLWYNVAVGAFLLPFELGNLVLVYLISLKVYDRSTALRCAVFYASLFVPLFVWLAWFDSFPLFLLLLGLYLILIRRPVLAGLATGAGFMTKLMPALLLPVAWRVFEPLKRKSLLYVAATLLTILVIALPFLLLRADLFVASFVNMVSRPPWETVWALLDGYYKGGGVAPLDQRFDPSTASQVDSPSTLPWPLVTVVFGLIYLVIYTRRIEWQNGRSILAFTGLSVSLFMLYSKGFSPQFLVYVLPFIVLLMPNLKGVIYALLLTVFNFLDWPIAQLMLPNQRWLFASAILFRTFLLLAVSVEYGLILFPSTRTWKLQRFVFGVCAITALVGSAIVGSLALRAYFEEQYAQDPYREVMDFLRDQDQVGIVVANESLYHRFYPFLAQSASLRLLGDDEWSMRRLEELTTERDLVWVVDIGTESEQTVGPVISRWLSEHTFPLGSQWFSNSRLTSYATGGVPSFRPEQADFGNELLLTGYGFDDGSMRAGEVVRLSLRWQALAEMEKDYTVLIRLVGPDGRTWGQRDAQPVGGFRPTSLWTVGEEVQDNHALLLSPDAPPGEYRVVLSLYDTTTGERVVLLDEKGEVRGDALELQTFPVR